MSGDNEKMYYAVYIPKVSDSPTHDGGGDGKKLENAILVFHSMDEVKEARKKYCDNKDLRFKKFSNYVDAAKFSTDGGGSPSMKNFDANSSGDFLRPASPRPASPYSAAEELPRPFASLSRPELTEFKKSIESKNMEKIGQFIDSNPRYLINCNGDTPTILHEGFRYNALHVAARVGHLESASLILACFHDKTCSYVRRLYPDDQDEETTDIRRRLLLDFYLNTPDKGRNETPLHFAAKNGHIPLLKYLCSYEECQRNSVNKFDQTPKDLILENDGIPADSKKAIIRILDQGSLYYVPLYRTRDESYPPVSRPPSCGLPASRLNLNKDQNVNYRLAAYIGPVDSKATADLLFTAWISNDISPNGKKAGKKTPKSQSKLAPSAAVKRSDLHKGMERIGRQIAADHKCEWSEYWNFLHSFVDLRTDDGLRLLEAYFRQKSTKEESEFHKVLESKLKPIEPKDDVKKKLDFSGDDDDESSKDSTDLFFDTSSGPNSPSSIGVVAENADSRDGYFTPPQELTADVIFGQEPTKLDRDVYVTLENADIDEIKYPHVAAWMKMIREFPDEERRRWAPLDSPRSASVLRKKMLELRASD